MILKMAIGSILFFTIYPIIDIKLFGTGGFGYYCVGIIVGMIYMAFSEFLDTTK
jgi:hypothetical protein